MPSGDEARPSGDEARPSGEEARPSGDEVRPTGDEAHNDEVVRETTPLSEVEVRTKLRESFLKGVNELFGEPCSIFTYDVFSLKAKFGGWDVDGSDVLFRDMETYLYFLDSARIRISDILSIEFDKTLS